MARCSTGHLAPAAVIRAPSASADEPLSDYHVRFNADLELAFFFLQPRTSFKEDLRVDLFTALQQQLLVLVVFHKKRIV